ncbi:DegV family protein [Halothermothrix orenii]|uniref:DegV family protein n=1 Tax=Halothermothrix orenii (strain H 168 / OCM 544 / DSM 9562) TaxID=373903 RepID=B8CX67_HALOH|nr:DegV family protein [Halothermothrix orenii]ACL69886.1 DegV family protein [Halothermothrix orenii H 168]
MKNKIITDSCCDLPDNLLKKLKNVSIVPMNLTVDGEQYEDRRDISLETFYKKLKSSSSHTTSASPSPVKFLNELSDAENSFVVTVSSSLSSSYNNALLARKMLLDDVKDRAVHIFDSLNASVGQGLVVLKINELINNDVSFNEIIETTENYIKNLKTFFILDRLDNLMKSGRINRILGRIVSALNIKFIMGKNDKGKIDIYSKTRGSKRAMKRILNIIGQYGTNFQDKILGIAHCNCYDKALNLKEEIQKQYNFKDIIITPMGPTISGYADLGGILVSF